jgi:MSHA type pilus biogenesis protein MshL
MRRELSVLSSAVALALLPGCGPMPVAKTEGHLRSSADKTPAAAGAQPAQPIPQTVRQVALPPPPAPKATEIRYSIVVNDVPVREVLFAIAKETRVNIDIHPGIEGRVTLNAIDQTIRQILTRISKQVDMRWESDGPNISVMPDSPYLKIYKVDYVNVQRDMSAGVNVSTQTAGGLLGGATATPGSMPSPPSNTSVFVVGNASKNRFWETLEKNIKDMLRETDKLLPEGSSETFIRRQGNEPQAARPSAASARSTPTSPAGNSPTTAATGAGGAPTPTGAEISAQTLTFREAASVIVNAETGVISIRATSRQHEKVTEFLTQVSGSARRQVLIEATVVEVNLNDAYKSGIDWSAMAREVIDPSAYIAPGSTAATPTIRPGYSFSQSFTGENFANLNPFSIIYKNPNAAAGGSISSTLKLLNTFGTIKVLSSPKIMALNNQMSILKVVSNLVYFEVQAATSALNQQAATTTFTTTQKTVPTGFVMYVTPQISENDTILLNVRPVVSRLIRYVNDPNPELKKQNVINQVPEIETREMESILSLSSGQTAILGGLMQDTTRNGREGLPLLARIPLFGDLVSYRNDENTKSELVIFIRPIVIKNPSVESDLADYRRYLPDQQFFKEAEPLMPGVLPPYDIKPNPVVPDPQPAPGTKPPSSP